MSPDLRMPVLAVAAWLGALWAIMLPPPGWWCGAAGLVALLALVLVAAAIRRGVSRAGREASVAHEARLRMTLAAGTIALLALTVAGFRIISTQDDPLAQLADQRLRGTMVGTVRSDPRLVSGGFSSTVVLTVLVEEFRSDRLRVGVRTAVRVLADPSWMAVRLGAKVRFSGRLQPSDDRLISAVARVSTRSAPEQVAGPSVWWRAAGRVRESIRATVEGRPAERAALVPALVDGDVSAVTPELAADFKVTGLTHLLAVSGTNLTLVVGALLWLARWCRVRGRWLMVVGASGIVGFILLARTEPSVVRAAAMGTVGLIAMSSNGRHRGLRALAVAVTLLVLFDPVMAVSIGFALSVLATAGILVIAPAWRDALGRWLPRWLAEAIAVPTAAQLACTPLIAAISGQISLVAVGANLLAEPAVGPATVLGLLGGLLGVVWPAAGGWCGWLASWCVGWIIAIAHRAAALPGAETGWVASTGSITVLTLVTLSIALWAPWALRRRWVGIAVAVVMVMVVAVRMPTGPWPPPGWVMVMCDVGQGDGLVLSAGPGAAIVIDAGPEPQLMQQCLDRLGVRQVPVAVFTHFDADHVGGASAVFRGRQVGEVWTTVLPGPRYGRITVGEAAKAAGVSVVPAQQGRTFSIGPVTAQVLWPPATLPASTDSNAGSVVLLVRTRGITLLLAGDVDPAASARIAGLVPGLRVDVLKVPHHGSRFQDEDWLVSLGAQVALASVGAGNTYGHPAAATLDPLQGAGAEVFRTDRDGAVAVIAGRAGMEVRTHR